MTDRTCILSGQNLPREQLIRFVAGPDGHAVADLACKLPGRGSGSRIMLKAFVASLQGTC